MLIDFKSKYPKFDLNLLLKLIISDLHLFEENYIHPKICTSNTFVHSSLKKKEYAIIFYYQENLSNFFHELVDTSLNNRSFFVYESNSVIGINK